LLEKIRRSLRIYRIKKPEQLADILKSENLPSVNLYICYHFCGTGGPEGTQPVYADFYLDVVSDGWNFKKKIYDYSAPLVLYNVDRAFKNAKEIAENWARTLENNGIRTVLDNQISEVK